MLELFTDNLAATEGFYGSVLGFPVLQQSAQRITFSVGLTRLTFRLVPGCKPFYHFAFLIPNNQLEEAFSWLSSRTPIIPFSDESAFATFDNWHARAFYFYDNHQNILEFICRFDLHNDAPVAFDASSVLSVNEIGIVVKDVLQERKRLQNKYGLPFFEKGPDFDDFTAMGDEHGLLLVVKNNRGWWPTREPAQMHMTKVDVANAGVTIQLIYP